MWTALLTAVVAATPQTIAVLELEAAGEATKDVVRQVTARVAEATAQTLETRVLSPDDVRSILVQEQQRQLAGCTDEGCLAELAGALGAEMVVSGRLALLEGVWSLSLTAVDATTVENRGRISETWGGSTLGLLELVSPVVQKLFSEAPETLVGTLELEGAVDGSRISMDGAPAGETPLDRGITVPAGAHQLELGHDGYETWTGWVVVPAGRRRTVTVEQVARPDTPLTEQWWFWGALGVLAAGGAAAAVVAATSGTGPTDPGGSSSGIQVGVNLDDAVTGGR